MSTTFRTTTAKFAGRCRPCGNPIKAGDKLGAIYALGFGCLACAQKEADAVVKRNSEKVRFETRTYAAGLIYVDQKMADGSERRVTELNPKYRGEKSAECLAFEAAQESK